MHYIYILFYARQHTKYGDFGTKNTPNLT